MVSLLCRLLFLVKFIKDSMNNKIVHNQKGVVLVYTLGVMSMLLAVALVFSNVMMSDLNQAKSIDNSVMAYYAADSGLEKSLFYLRQADKDIAFIRGITRFDLLKNNYFWSTSRSTSSEQLF